MVRYSLEEVFSSQKKRFRDFSQRIESQNEFYCEPNNLLVFDNQQTVIGVKKQKGMVLSFSHNFRYPEQLMNIPRKSTDLFKPLLKHKLSSISHFYFKEMCGKEFRKNPKSICLIFCLLKVIF